MYFSPVKQATFFYFFHMSGSKQNLQMMYTFPHLFSEVRWYVPCPKQNIRDGNFYKVFTYYLWLLMLVTFILTTVIMTLLRKTFGCEPVNHHSISYNAYYIWSIITSISVPVMPRNAQLRAFFMLVVCYSLTLSTVFQSFFSSFLTESGLEKQVSSLDELQNTNSSLYGERDTETYFALVNFVGYYRLSDYQTTLGVKFVDSPVQTYPVLYSGGLGCYYNRPNNETTHANIFKRYETVLFCLLWPCLPYCFLRSNNFIPQDV
ncbi:hypothetical protein L9F63_027673 [Diploptera punctata]|uniref:Ionotropic glutamate receptor C-terminal domain-containing protein n=1 Tax=Diploptera punctata TaxID=6984 RepID=A0AAD8A6U0_DIPPU|nr:hypothetical protein L9F63_027673 [Diploptera punctata]